VASDSSPSCNEKYQESKPLQPYSKFSWMICIIGDSNKAEYSAAETLRDLIVSGWPWIEQAADSSITILVGVQCHGQIPKDLDLVLLAYLPKRPAFQLKFNPKLNADENTTTPTTKIESFCVIIEVKDHDARSVRFRGTNVEVLYNNEQGQKWKSATDQSEEQKYSLKKYLDAHTGRAPWIGNLIWLRNVTSKDIPKGLSNVMPSQFTLNSLFNYIANTYKLFQNEGGYLLSSTRSTDTFSLKEAERFLTVKIEPTSLDRRRMDRVIAANVDEAWLDETCPQQLVFRGRGGTGKTMLLLQLAWRLHSNGRKVLFLTYNHALVSDLRRLITLLGIDDDISSARFEIRTVHSFFYAVFSKLEVISEQDDFLGRYEELKNTVLQYLECGALASGDLDDLCKSDPETFEWDRLLIDEGQDWPTNEMNLLRRLYGARKLIIADGVDQLVRQDSNCDWLRGLHRGDYRVCNLDSGLRMKRNLALFANTVADAFGLAGWRVRPNDEANGGRVIVVEGNYFEAQNLHSRLIREAKSLGNEPVDMLACVPPSFISQDEEEMRLAVDPMFHAVGQDVWNGTNVSVRSNTYPISSKQLRVVQYDSCRGLEGWTCLNFALDVFFDHKFNLWTSSCDNTSHCIPDDNTRSKLHAARWVMIPLTRAIDTIVIHINDRNSFFGKLIRKVSEGPCKDYVEWVSTTEFKK
jgi:hypothetical protein